MKLYCELCKKVQPVRIDNCRDSKTNEPYQDIVCAECDFVIASGTDIAQPEQRGHCACGDPEALGVVHFRTRPCFHYTEPLAQPEQEPVKYKCTIIDDEHPNGIPLEQWGNTAPPKREWVGLTRRELDIATLGLEDLSDCYKAIEAKLKEKNT